MSTGLPTTTATATVVVPGPLPASVRAVSVLPRPVRVEGYGGYDTWTRTMAHIEGFGPPLGVELSPHKEPPEDVDDFFADDPGEVRGAP